MIVETAVNYYHAKDVSEDFVVKIRDIVVDVLGGDILQEGETVSGKKEQRSVIS